MKRDKMVTRTFITTTLQVLFVNTITAETYIKVVTLPGKVKNDADALKVLVKSHSTPTITPVAIKGKREDQALYGMAETTFISQAKILSNQAPEKVDDNTPASN